MGVVMGQDHALPKTSTSAFHFDRRLTLRELLMWPYLLISLCLAGSPNDTDSISRELTAQCQTGTLIFSQGDCLAVKIYSRSRFTHCAAVVIEDGRPVVYDSMNGVGVRQTDLAEYLKLQTPSEIQILHPTTVWTPQQTEAFHTHLRSQLGRPYGIKHHITGNRATGVHCAEYCTDALLAAEQFEVEEPARVSPGKLYDGLTERKQYADGGLYALRMQTPPPAAKESWCGWAWRETYECTTGCCRQLSRWMLCREK